MTATIETLARLPSYKNPPVDEVVCGCQFQPLGRFKLPHLGLFWEKFRREFPTTEHAPPLVSEGGLQRDSVTGLPWPRTWFINEDESRLIQFQPDRLHFNWRRRERGQPYPRYPEMIAGFEKCFNEFDAFVAEQGLGFVQPVAFELTYLNHVTADDGWKSAADLPKILRDFCWKAEGDRFLPIPASVFWQAAFQLPNNTGLLVAKLNEAVRTQDEARVLVLELSARGLNPDKSTAGLRDWFDQAHVWIVNGFADLTMLDIQKTNWGRER